MKKDNKPLKGKKIELSNGSRLSIIDDDIVIDRHGISEQHKEFCKLYVVDWNATEAYTKVFGGKNYSVIRTRASELLRRKSIQAYCDFLNENLEITTGVSRSWIMQQHLKLVRNSIADLHNTWIDRKAFEDLTPDQKECIESIETQTRTEQAEGEDGTTSVQVDYVKIKLYNKQKALEAITRMMGYDKAARVDITSGGKPLNTGTVVNVQINVYNVAPPLAGSEDKIQP